MIQVQHEYHKGHIQVFKERLALSQASKRTGTSRTGDGLFLVTGTLDTDGTLGTLSGQSLCTFS